MSDEANDKLDDVDDEAEREFPAMTVGIPTAAAASAAEAFSFCLIAATAPTREDVPVLLLLVLPFPPLLPLFFMGAVAFCVVFTSNDRGLVFIW